MRQLLCMISLLYALSTNVSAGEDFALPAISAGNLQATSRLEFFLSPTCTLCAATFRNTVLPLLSKATSGADLFIFVGITPRSDRDVKFARVLSCVPQDELLLYMTKWFFHLGTNEPNFDELLHMGKEFSIIGSSEEQCVNDRTDKSLLGFNNLIFTEKNLRVTPAVFLNGKHLADTYYFWQLEERLPQLVGSKK